MDTRRVKGTEIINRLKKLAQTRESLSGDNSGLLIGTSHKDVKKVLITLDVTLDVVNEAIAHKADMIICHHSVLSTDCNHLITDTVKGKMISWLLQHDIAVYCTQGSLDIAIAGVNDMLCKKLELSKTEVLKEIPSERYFKLVTCVPVLPEDYTLQIINRIGDLGLANGTDGAGVVGDYSHVCDYVKGVQQFIPMAKANPFIGTNGVMESVEVDRLEMIVPEGMVDEVLRHVNDIHPYEEVEYDLYHLREPKKVSGLGRIGVLSEDKSIHELIREVKMELGVSIVKVAGDYSKKIRKVAVCAGSKSSLIKEAYEKGADLFITGDVSYAEGHLAKELGIVVIDAGRWSTEIPLVSYLKKALDSEFNEHGKIIEVIESKINTEPFIYV